MNLLKRFIFVYIYSVFFLITSFYPYSCSAEKSEFVDVDEFDDYFERPEFKTAEDYVLWFGYGCPSKTDYNPEEFSKKEKRKYIQEGVDSLKKYKDLYCCERLVLYYHEMKDQPKTLYWALVGAEKGSGHCMSVLRWFYARGDGVIQDSEEAVKWCYLAAAKGREEDVKLLKDLTGDERMNEFLKNGKNKANEWSKKNPEAFFDSN